MATSTTVTPVDLVRDTGTIVTGTLCVEDGADGIETLIITPTVPAYRLVVIINNIATDQGTITVNVTAGDYWMAKAMTAVTIVQAAAANIPTSKAFVFNAARYQAKADSHIHMTLTPAAGIKLKTGHDVTWMCFQLPL